MILLVTSVCLLFLSRNCDGYTTPNNSNNRPNRQGIPFVRKQDMIGIWQLTTTTTTTTTTHSILSSLTTSTKTHKDNLPNDDGNNDNDNKKNQKSIVLRLNDDGSFDPYTTTTTTTTTINTRKIKERDASKGNNLESILSRGGSWNYCDGNLILAPDRRPIDNNNKNNKKDMNLGTNIQDTLLTGKINVHVSKCLPATDSMPLPMEEEEKEEHHPDDQSDTDVHLSVPFGNVTMGKFMYPRRHKAFFDQPMLFSQTSIGTFAMKQLLGNLNTRFKQQKQQQLQEEQQQQSNESTPQMDRKDFYGRQFYLTATPHAVNPALAAQDKHYNKDTVKYDVRVMPITFHSNNTFTAIGTEKILRGRFGITQTNGQQQQRRRRQQHTQQQLWFQVNLFGFGRSAPGSVYSEGRLLSHEDQRGYLGTTIQFYPAPNDPTNRTMLYFVQGEYYYGTTDLKRSNKAHSWGTFSLQEIHPTLDKNHYTRDTVVVDEEDDDDDEESILENLFKASGNSSIRDSAINDDDSNDFFQ
ncbi:hypothetical protein IV203_002255 [Nitzschia inconspicua]|uniref:Uncharacterized protein n=1 Tax=Nitzschia inconspicua TaxID=303405 RepID=A0A9K3PS28_9STRA|nr:hypothetical protein IV203_002255 [Nitzschia inconspicua]